jgi:hypothetical protein
MIAAGRLRRAGQYQGLALIESQELRWAAESC